MAALASGTKAPEFELKTLDGKGFSLRDELARSPVVLAFFKVSCPTCQYALPFWERLYKAYGKNGVALVGILAERCEGHGVRSRRNLGSHSRSCSTIPAVILSPMLTD